MSFRARLKKYFACQCVKISQDFGLKSKPKWQRVFVQALNNQATLWYNVMFWYYCKSCAKDHESMILIAFFSKSRSEGRKFAANSWHFGRTRFREKKQKHVLRVLSLYDKMSATFVILRFTKRYVGFDNVAWLKNFCENKKRIFEMPKNAINFYLFIK